MADTSFLTIVIHSLLSRVRSVKILSWELKHSKQSDIPIVKSIDRND